jgi:hypothetical protein
VTASAGWNGEYWIATGSNTIGEISLKRSYNGRQWTDINLGPLSNSPKDLIQQMSIIDL